MNGKKVVIKNELWLSIADKNDILCTECIEGKLGRKIEAKDFKMSNKRVKALIKNNGVKYFGRTIVKSHIPVNLLYAELNNIKLQ